MNLSAYAACKQPLVADTVTNGEQHLFMTLIISTNLPVGERRPQTIQYFGYELNGYMA